MSRLHSQLDRRRWRVFRRAVLDRDGWRCQKCGRAGRLEVDHLVPLQWGGAPFDLANGQSLCIFDHIQKTRAENTRRDPERDAWKQYTLHN